jgi:L-rhamnonate dehydratase
MLITQVEAIYLRLPEIRERCDGSQDTLIVRVHTDAGITGIGEVDSSPPVAKAIIEAPYSHAISQGLAASVVGQDPLEIDRLWDRMYQGAIFFGRRGAAIQAMSGIDMALWDIAGKALGLPVYKLLGGGYRDRFRAYASILFGETPRETREIGARLRDQGFTAVKFGWGPMGQEEANDLALVREARRGVSDALDLMVDAGICWDTATAIRRARQFAEWNIYWLEEPLHPDNLAGYGKLAANSPVRIAAGEQESSRASYLELMDTGNVDVVQVDVARCGGLTEARKIGQLSVDRHRMCVNHSYKTGVSIAASLHFLAALPNTELLEYCVEQGALRQTLTKQKFAVEEGWVAVPQEPGLGVELDEEVLARYRVA